MLGRADLLATPERALVFPGEAGEVTWSPEVLEAASRYHAEQDWAALASLYQHLADTAWSQGHRAASVRLLLAERCLAERADDQRRLRECTYFLATRHRLQANFLPAEAWAHEVLRCPLTDESATMHVAAWRELAAIREASSDYDQGLEFCDDAETVARRHARAPGMSSALAKTLLQRAVLLRLRGTLDLALEALDQARELVGVTDVDELTSGLIELRAGGIQIVIGRADAALAAYESAERHFAGVSDHNLLIARVRQVSCLRALGRLEPALALSDDLAARFLADADGRRLGQVLLERAEVLHDLEDEAAVRATLERARPLFERGTDLEALRWHLHVARVLINRGDDTAEAVRHLQHVLRHATAPGQADLTRTMLALHDVTRLPEAAGIPLELRVGASRAALLAAELQRGSLSNPAERWSLHALREETYTAAVLLHAAMSDTEAVARITEAGRADLLNQLLSAPVKGWPGPVTELQVVPRPRDPELAGAVFAVAAAVGAGLGQKAPRDAVSQLLPLADLPADAELDELADIIVLSHLAFNGSRWWSSVATRRRRGGWGVVVRDAPAPVAALLDRLNTGRLLPPRGISARTWELLGTFLLPDPAIWAGASDRPGAVLICPDPRLWQVPYAALTRAGTFLAEVAEVALTPSLRTTLLLRDRARRRPAARVAVDRPALALLEAGLPGHEAERAALAAWPGGLTYLETIGDLADGQAPALLYISGHGDRPGAASQLGRTRITLDRLANSALPPLVFLNGCWSGTTDGRFGQDPFSLAVGALIGGAEVVIAGIGHIDSAASAHVAARSLSLLQQGRSPGAALRQAQNQIRASHPELTAFDWASLSAVGN